MNAPGHSESCALNGARVARCLRCSWLKHAQKWTARLSICSSAPELGSWVNIVNTPEWALGCKVCGTFGAQGLWAENRVTASTSHTPAIGIFKQHASTQTHKLAVQTYMTVTPSSSFSAQSLSKLERPPDTSQWLKVLSETRAGKGHMISGLEGVGARKKVRTMQWCLAESKRDLDRKFVLSCKSICICQDMRNTRLILTRFRASDAMPSVIARGCWPRRRHPRRMASNQHA